MAAAAVLFKMAINLLRDCSWQKELILRYAKAQVGNLDHIGIGDISPFINKGVTEDPPIYLCVSNKVHQNYY